MAWNPSPEVQVARDAAGRLGVLAKTRVEQIVIVYITEDDHLGTVSYGKDKAKCSDAKLLSEKLYERTIAHWQDYA